MTPHPLLSAARTPQAIVAAHVAGLVNLDKPTLTPTGARDPQSDLPLFIDKSKSKYDWKPIDILDYFASFPFNGGKYRLTNGYILIRRHETLICYQNADIVLEAGRREYVDNHRSAFVKTGQSSILHKAFFDDYDGPIALVALAKKTDFGPLLRISEDSSRIPIASCDNTDNKTYDRNAVRRGFAALKGQDPVIAKAVLEYATKTQWPLSVGAATYSKKIPGKKEKIELAPLLTKLVQDMPRADSPEFAMVKRLFSADLKKGETT